MSDSKPSIRILGKKIGMTRVFDKEGTLVVCSVVQVEPNVVAQVKTKESDGYSAVKLGADRLSSAKKKNLSKPLLKDYEKKNIDPRRHLFESRVDDTSSFELGQEIGVDHFSEGAFIDVTGTSKGKGFQGVMKRHNFKGGPAAHGSGFHRHAGSTGNCSTPGRVFKGRPMPGQMGNEQVTVQNLKVVKVDVEKNVILVKGAIPGSRTSKVWIQSAVKKTA
ncbi:MAG: 50S ribosomal protein L3 [Rhabdochlamydiaceae bacterium]|nr:50S ribosomal protein L3 [Candidatus Amphrikana amoebophyrae]